MGPQQCQPGPLRSAADDCTLLSATLACGRAPAGRPQPTNPCPIPHPRPCRSLVERCACQKGCTGPVVRAIQRFGKLGKRAWGTSSSPDLSDRTNNNMKVGGVHLWLRAVITETETDGGCIFG